jgi:hypothetical protein
MSHKKSPISDILLESIIWDFLVAFLDVFLITHFNVSRNFLLLNTSLRFFLLQAKSNDNISIIASKCNFIVKSL